jgi:O-antigen ligase
MVRGRRAVWSLAALAALAALIIAASPELRARAAGTFATTGVNAGRIGIWRANLDIVREHPIVGLGFGRYRTAALPYYERHPDADRRSHAHSNYLHLAAEAGLAGLAAFALVLATALLRGWTAVAQAGDDRTWVTAAGAWTGMLGFLVGGVTQYTFGDSEVALTMWVVLGLLMRLRDP